MKTAIKIISMLLVTVTLLTTSVASAFAYGVVIEEQAKIYDEEGMPIRNNAKDKKYGEEWLEIAGWEKEEGDLNYYYYQALYEYYEEEPETTESTPDCVLIFACPHMESPWGYSIVIGRYYFYHKAPSPYDTVYCIYLPKEGKVISLKEAYEAKIPGIKECLEHTHAGLFGDMDMDRKLSVKDATYIQKCLAGLERFSGDHYIAEYAANGAVVYAVADFNRDDVVNIRDATAIQKHIAGLEY